MGKCINQKERSAWGNARHRCTDPSHHAYARYGGRGITFCDRWMNSFDNFLEDMGLCPDPKWSIDRIDNDKGYYKENCRWTDAKTQANNRSDNGNHFTPFPLVHCSRSRDITYNNETRTAVQWEKLTGIKSGNIRKRLDEHNWTIGQALGFENPPPVTTQDYSKRSSRNKDTMIQATYNGETKTLKQWAKDLNQNYIKFYKRHKKGLTDGQILGFEPI